MGSQWIGLPFFVILFSHLAATTGLLPFNFIGSDCMVYQMNATNSANPLTFTLMAPLACVLNSSTSSSIENIFTSLNCSQTCVLNSTGAFPDPRDLQQSAVLAAQQHHSIIVGFVFLGAVLPILLYVPLIFVTRNYVIVLSKEGVAVHFQLETGPFGGNVPTKTVLSPEGAHVFVPGMAVGVEQDQDLLLMRRLGLEMSFSKGDKQMY